MSTQKPAPEGRVARSQRRKRKALLSAASAIMTEKGVDATTMLEIAERADVGAGTVYSYFKSKEELAIAVLEDLMHQLGLRIEMVTRRFDDPAQVYAFGIRNVLDEAVDDPRWRLLLHRSEFIADAAYRMMGPFAIRDLQQAQEAGRFEVPDPELVWRLATTAIFGAALAIVEGRLPGDSRQQVITRILCMTGIGTAAAAELAARDRPPLPELPDQPED